MTPESVARRWSSAMASMCRSCVFAPRSPSRTVKGKARLANRKAWDSRAITPIRRIKEFRDFSLDVKPGDSIGADVFEAGDHVENRDFSMIIESHPGSP